MNERLTLYLAVVLTMTLLAAGCGPQPLPEEPTPIPTLAPATLPAATATEPSQAGATSAPEGQATPGETADLGEAGRQVFEQNCAACHNLTDETKVGPGLAGLFDLAELPNGEPFSEDNLGTWIRNGGGAMPGIPLSDPDLEAVITFLKDATQ